MKVNFTIYDGFYLNGNVRAIAASFFKGKVGATFSQVLCEPNILFLQKSNCEPTKDFYHKKFAYLFFLKKEMKNETN